MDDAWKQKALDFFQNHGLNYRLTFQREQPANMYVLGDLYSFCHMNTSIAVMKDPIEMAIREGRRQVGLRINRAINLTNLEMLLLNVKDQQQ